MMLHHPAAMVSISLAGRLLGGEVKEMRIKEAEDEKSWEFFWVYICIKTCILFIIYKYMCIHNRNEIECNNSGNHWKGVTNDL